MLSLSRTHILFVYSFRMIMQRVSCAGRERERERERERDEGNGFTVDLVTVKVGAHGFVQYNSFYHLNNLLGTFQKDLLNHLVEVAKVTIKNSFHIWTLRNCWFDHSEDTVSVRLSLSPLLNFYFSKLVHVTP